jgi:hypothetical protein
MNLSFMLDTKANEKRALDGGDFDAFSYVIPQQYLCGRQSGTGAGLLRAFRFLLPILVPPAAPNSSPVIRRAKWIDSRPTPTKKHAIGTEITIFEILLNTGIFFHNAGNLDVAIRDLFRRDLPHYHPY